MITGINSDVRWGARVYHIQTQDLGTSDCTLESLVFVGGLVLDRICGSYAEIAAEGALAIRKRLIAQHRAVIASIDEGKYAEPVAPALAPEEQAAQEEKAAREPLDLVVTEIEDCFAGAQGSLLILIRTGISYQPIAGANLEVFFPPVPAPENRIYAAGTDEKGFHLAEFRIPRGSSPEPHLLVKASCPAGGVESRLAVSQPLEEIASVGGTRADSKKPARGGPSADGRRPARPCLVISELDEPHAGSRVSFLLLLHEEHTRRAIPAADLRVLLRVEGAGERTLYEATTDARGFHLAEFGIPPRKGVKSSLLIQASSELGVAEVIVPVVV